MKTLQEIIAEFSGEDERGRYSPIFFDAAILREVEPGHFQEAMENILRISSKIEDLRKAPSRNNGDIEELSNTRLRYINLLGYIGKRDPNLLVTSLKSSNQFLKQIAAIALTSYPNRKAVAALKQNLIETENESLGELFRTALEACKRKKPLIIRIVIGLMTFGGIIKIISLITK